MAVLTTVWLGCTVNASFAAVPGVMSNAALAADVRPVAPALSAYPVPARAILRSANVAMPLTAVFVSVPARTPPIGFVPMATVTAVDAVVTVLPNASCTATCTLGVIARPATVVLGCTLQPSLLGVPAVILNAVLIAPARPFAVAASVLPLPALSGMRSG